MALGTECESFKLKLYCKYTVQGIQDEQPHQADWLPWIHFKWNTWHWALFNLGTFMLQQPWCDFPNLGPKSFLVYNINSGIVHENTGFCEAAKQDYVLERTSSRCKTKSSAEPFPLLACPSLVWWHWSLAVIQNHTIHTFCVLLPVWSHWNTTMNLPLPTVFKL